MVSGGESIIQLSQEVAAQTSEQHDALLDELFKMPGKFIVHIPPAESLALKCDLQLPWAKLREMRRYNIQLCISGINIEYIHVLVHRWLKCWGVAIAGENRMRTVSGELLGENLEAVATPLTFRLKDGGEEILPAPMVYVKDLWTKVEDLLNNSDDNTQGYIHLLANIASVHVQ